MASPQLEDGYTRIANELMEALYRTKLSGQRLRILMYVMRESYGYRRLMTKDFTYGTACKELDMNRQHLVREMTWLNEHSYITKAKGDDQRASSDWSMQKDYTRWGSTEIGTTDNQMDQQSSMVAVQEQRIISSTEIGSTEIGTSPQIGTKDATEIGTPHTPLKEERKLKETPTTASEVESRLAALGLWPKQIKVDLAKKPDFSIQDVAACEAWIEANGHLPRPDLTLHTQFLQHGKIPAVPIRRTPQRSRAAPPVIEAPPPTQTLADVQAAARLIPKRLPGKTEL